jgi:hypothetical protein
MRLNKTVAVELSVWVSRQTRFRYHVNLSFSMCSLS